MITRTPSIVPKTNQNTNSNSNQSNHSTGEIIKISGLSVNLIGNDEDGDDDLEQRVFDVEELEEVEK
jgi:hypothetical protein